MGDCEDTPDITKYVFPIGFDHTALSGEYRTLVVPENTKLFMHVPIEVCQEGHAAHARLLRSIEERDSAARRGPRLFELPLDTAERQRQNGASATRLISTLEQVGEKNRQQRLAGYFSSQPPHRKLDRANLHRRTTERLFQQQVALAKLIHAQDGGEALPRK